MMGIEDTAAEFVDGVCPRCDHVVEFKYHGKQRFNEEEHKSLYECTFCYALVAEDTIDKVRR